jgi:lactoylglutathione lyase
MFSHVFVGVSDFDRALAFYEPVMAALGIPSRVVERSRPWAGWQTPGGPRPLFLIGRPYDRLAHDAGNGQMVAFLATDRDRVDRFHAAALANGGTCDGPPGPRPEYHADYYGAYVRDPDGNKLCAACHDGVEDGAGGASGRRPAAAR